jgi:hypothetical protein
MAWSVVHTGRSLEETLGEDSSLATSMLATRANECSLRIIGNALDMKALQKELLGYGLIANGPNGPQVHQNCARADLSEIDTCPYV